jgi:N-methylhydantoinase A/oxoprolinase/acetone carboxylase beta subunit
MLLGVDVGGTHTDAALLREIAPGRARALASFKAPTRERALAGLVEVLEGVLSGVDPAGVKRLTVSTTLALNSVLTGAADPVGVLAASGPGLDPDPADWGPLFRLVPGRQDHRGRILEPCSKTEAAAAAVSLKDAGAKILVAAAKFGPKNPALEDELARIAGDATGLEVMGASRLFGGLNLPRRLSGAILNAAVKRIADGFLDDLAAATARLGLSCPVNVLKADGGMMSLERARPRPVLALAAGPAASLLGLWALSGESGSEGDVLMIDIGGTSSDLAVLSRGEPLLTSIGLTLASRPTLVRGLVTRSVALGGDVDLELEGASVVPRPRRRGPALALAPGDLGRRPPTLTDALNVLGDRPIGDKDVSERAMAALGAGTAREAAQSALDSALGLLRTAAASLVSELNSQPVYTIGDYLVDWRLDPVRAVFLGGPAETLAPLAESGLGLQCRAPKGADTANALGAALAKPSVEAELYADTALGVMSAPTLGASREIGPGYDLGRARGDLLELMGGGEDLRVTVSESFSQISDAGRSGRVIRVAAQSAPGLAARLA